MTYPVTEIYPRAESRIRLVPFNEIKLGTARRYLVKNLIPRVGLIVVWGPPKSGKSFWTFDVVMHVALDRDYRGRRVHGGPVVYCAFEGQSGLEARVEAFRQRFLADDPTGDVPFYLEPVTLDLVANHTDLTAVIQRQLVAPPVAVVLDTLNRSLSGSESSDEDMTAYVRAADAIRETFGCAVIIVHHCGVDGSRPRGHTALTGAADAQIAVRRDAADNIVAELELAKDGPQGDTILSRLEVEEVGIDEDGETITSCVVLPVDGEPVSRDRRSKGPRLGDAETIALKAIKYVTENGASEAAPPLPGVRQGTVAVKRDDVRARANAAGFAGDDDPTSDKVRQRWSRALKKLVAVDAVRQEGELLWLL